jgi:hypothetical protein
VLLQAKKFQIRQIKNLEKEKKEKKRPNQLVFFVFFANSHHFQDSYKVFL